MQWRLWVTVLASLWLLSCGGGGGSTPVVPPRNPAPNISTIVGGGTFTLTVTGSGFISSSEVRWNGTNRATTFFSATQLQATIPESDIAAAGTAQVTVSNPAPGGGVSGAAPFAINNPVPAIISVSPDNRLVGSSDFTLTVVGSNFISGSIVRWDGSGRPTTFVSGTELRASIPASDLMEARISQVSVVNPAPGGGMSSSTAFAINNPVPAISSISPNNRAAGSGDFTLNVVGSNFVSGSTVRWNGDARPTTFISGTELRASVPASDLVGAGTSLVGVTNALPGGGESNRVALFVFMNLTTNALVFDPFTQKIFASLPSSAPLGNSVAIIDPSKGTVEGTVFIGSEPSWLAISDDGQFLYVALDGAAAVRQFDIPTQTPGIQFALGSDSFFGPMFAEDMVVILGVNTALAVSRFFQGVSPRHAGVAIYDNGVSRPNTTQTHTGSNRIEPSASPGRLYGYNNETTEFGFRRLDVDANGVTELDAVGNLISGFGVDIEFAGGRVYSTTGGVIDPEAKALLGTFTGISFAAAVEPDPVADRVYFVTVPGSLLAFSASTFTPSGSATIPGLNGDVSSLIRWGQDGLAFRTNQGQVFLLSVAHALPSLTLVTQTAQLTTVSLGRVSTTGSNHILTVKGSAFSPHSIVRWNGASKTTNFVSDSELQALIPASDVARSGGALITVFNPGEGGGESTSMKLDTTGAPDR